MLMNIWSMVYWTVLRLSCPLLQYSVVRMINLSLDRLYLFPIKGIRDVIDLGIIADFSRALISLYLICLLLYFAECSCPANCVYRGRLGYSIALFTEHRICTP